MSKGCLDVSSRMQVIHSHMALICVNKALHQCVPTTPKWLSCSGQSSNTQARCSNCMHPIWGASLPPYLTRTLSHSFTPYHTHSYNYQQHKGRKYLLISTPDTVSWLVSTASHWHKAGVSVIFFMQHSLKDPLMFFWDRLQEEGKKKRHPVES